MSRFPGSRTQARDRRSDPTPRRPTRHDGHRHEHVARPVQRRSFKDRLRASVLDIAVHRAVASRDLVKHQFDGHPYAGRRGIDTLKNDGLVTETETPNPETGRADRYLVATPAGQALAATIAAERGLDPNQRTWNSTGKQQDLHHDLAIYRAVATTRHELRAKGFHVRRLRLDAELRGHILRRAEAARSSRGPAAADQVRRNLALQHRLPVDADGHILYPDAQLEYTASPDAPSLGRVNIDVTTQQYRGAAIAAKNAAGFVLFASGPKAARNLASALQSIGAVGNDRGIAPSGGRRGGSPGDGLLEL